MAETPPNLENLTPPPDLTPEQRSTVFEHFYRCLADYRISHEIYATTENELSSTNEHDRTLKRKSFNWELLKWAQKLLQKAWVVCEEPGAGKCPSLDDLTDTSTAHLDPLPSEEQVSRILSTVLFFHVTTSKQYSPHTRTFLSAFPGGSLHEQTIVKALKRPEEAIQAVQSRADASREEHASRSSTLRMLGVGAGAVVGGALIGVTGGLAAPVVGAGVSAILGFLGVGGTAAGMFATGLAGSSVVCGSLFGAYGAKRTSEMVENHTREVRDLAIVPVNVKSLRLGDKVSMLKRKLKTRGKKGKGQDIAPKNSKDETLGVRLCISGWLSNEKDVVNPWTIFSGNDMDTYALQWEVKALEDLSDAFESMLTAQAWKYAKAQIIKRTILATLMRGLGPLAYLKFGQIMDNPWMNAKALAVRTGAVLGDLLAKRAWGNRPITLTGYSLGSLVIFEALKYLASLPASETIHLVQDVFLFGTPASINPEEWSAARRVVSGRLLNGYSSDDFILAILFRATSAAWGVAGLEEIKVPGVENVKCEGVDGHLKWRGMIGKCLQQCGAPGISEEEVAKQVQLVAVPMAKLMELSNDEATQIVKESPAPPASAI